MKELILSLKEINHYHPWVLWVIIVLCLWEGVWKVIGMWKAARSNKLGWFIVLAVINSVGILPIIYIILYEYPIFIDKKPPTPVAE